MQKIVNFINGEFCPPVSGNYIDNVNPAEGKVYSLVADSDGRDVQLAVDAARKAFHEWSLMPVAQRSSILERIAKGIEDNLEQLALAESIDNGKPLTLARTLDIPRAAANMRFYSSAIVHFASEAHITGSEAINYTSYTPAGIAGCISPWNLPLYLFTWKIAPALAAGCTVIAKPSELTPMTAFLFASICKDAGLPAGTLNILQGLGSKVGQAIIEHPDISVISFTGGTATGKKIASTAAPMFKRLSLELGGKNPNLIFADADFEKAVSTSIQSSFSNQGEICLCGSRIFVEASIYQKFVDEFVKRTRELTVGDPLLDHTKIGALVSRQHMDKVTGYLALAKNEGGKILCGGECVHVSGRCDQGYFISPAVITGLSHTCRTNQEEIFGPVVTISSFQDESQAVELANSTPYGLAATIWTENLSRAHRVAASVKCGIIWVNCWLFRDLRTPFGGMKQSGVGREGGWDAIRFFMETKNVCIKL